jgi:hypothetical protein
VRLRVDLGGDVALGEVGQDVLGAVDLVLAVEEEHRDQGRRLHAGKMHERRP